MAFFFYFTSVHSLITFIRSEDLKVRSTCSFLATMLLGKCRLLSDYAKILCLLSSIVEIIPADRNGAVKGMEW